MRPTPVGWIYAAALLAGLGIVAAEGAPPMAVAAVCVAAGAGVWGVAGTRVAAARLEAALEGPESAFAGERAPVRWKVRNASKWFAIRVEGATFLATFPVASVGAFALGPGEERSIVLWVPCRHRGELTIAECSVRVAGILPLLASAVVRPLGHRIVVFPRPAALRRELPELLEPELANLDRAPWAWVHGDEDFSGVRQYRPGDSPRRIHWHSSFRLPGEWRVKEFATPEGGEATVVLDGRAPRFPGMRWRANWERAVAAAGALARALVQRGWSVRLVLPGQALPAGASLGEIYGALAFAAPGATEWEPGGREVVFVLSPNDEVPWKEAVVFGPDAVRAHFAFVT